MTSFTATLKLQISATVLAKVMQNSNLDMNNAMSKIIDSLVDDIRQGGIPQTITISLGDGPQAQVLSFPLSHGEVTLK